jgi:hypothetical protein
VTTVREEQSASEGGRMNKIHQRVGLVQTGSMQNSGEQRKRDNEDERRAKATMRADRRRARATATARER